MNFLCVFILVAALVGGAASCRSLPEQSSPEFSEASKLYQKAYELYHAQCWQDAGILFRQYIRNYPATDLYRVALYYLGNCEQELGNVKDALLIFNTILNKFPDNDFWVEAARKRIVELKS